MFLAPQADVPVSGKAWGLRVNILGNDSGYAIPVDISHSVVLKYSLWQLQFHSFYDSPNKTYPFNSTLGPVIEGMGSPFFLLNNKTLVSNNTFFKIGQGKSFTLPTQSGMQAALNASTTDLRDYLDPTPLTNYKLKQYPEAIIEVAAPVGVRCVVSSEVGTAILDGVTSTFSNFSRVQPEPELQGSKGGVFGSAAQNILYGTRYIDFYLTSHLPGNKAALGNLGRYQSYIPSTALLQSVLLAYGIDAIDNMYGITYGLEAKWESTDLTSSREGKILNIASLIPGHGTGYFVLALFCLWSALSVVLGVVYGFRKRPSDKLDGYSMFKHGAEMADDLKHNDELLRAQTFYKNKTLFLDENDLRLSPLVEPRYVALGAILRGNQQLNPVLQHSPLNTGTLGGSNRSFLALEKSIKSATKPPAVLPKVAERREEQWRAPVDRAVNAPRRRRQWIGLVATESCRSTLHTIALG
ncbi:hypothetical protein V501_01691 [Pseudogymnoascus sp. VKM F-4519 (FW-2642)]|nr:hypothetical protein V501_01691 [Pseudogymnoascus sp. VKM F-4519 (FW-2642)]